MATHGAPDWSQYRPNSASFPSLDLAELAARLDSPDTFDRRGDVIFASHMEHGLTEFGTTTSGTGATVAADTSQSLRGAQSIKLTAGSDASAIAALWKPFHYPPSGMIGLETWIAFESGIDIILLTIELYNGDNLASFSAAYNHTNTRLRVKTGSGTWATIATNVNLYVSQRLYIPFKLVVQHPTTKYKRFLVGPTEYDISTYSYTTSASATRPYALCVITAQGPGGTNPNAWVDRFIFTHNEP